MAIKFQDPMSGDMSHLTRTQQIEYELGRCRGFIEDHGMSPAMIPLLFHMGLGAFAQVHLYAPREIAAPYVQSGLSTLQEARVAAGFQAEYVDDAWRA